MKKTLSVNIASMAFTIDEDAYYTLNGYYEDIRSRLYEAERKEVMDDVESRTADIFRENLSFPAQVISLDLVKRTIAIIGPSHTFGEKQYDQDTGKEPKPESEIRRRFSRKLFRSRYDNVIGGVCGGIAEYFGIDSGILRLVTFLLVFLGGLSLWIYIVAWIILPMEPKDPLHEDKKGRKHS